MKKASDLSRFSISRFTGRLLLFFPLFLFIFFLAGPSVSRLLLPVMETEMRVLRPHYNIALSYTEPARIAYKIAIPFVWTDETGKRQEGIVKEGRLPASNVAIHPILVLSVLLAWPTVPWKKKGGLVFLSLPFILAAELLDIPLHILWKVENGIPLETLSAGLVKFWGHVLNNGGKQFLSLVAVFVSLGAYTLFYRRREKEAGVPVGRNDPCPCGSGKKYKNCCME